MKNEILKDKKIFFLSLQTFNYEKAIANKLKDLGAIVDYFDERPANSIFVKGIIRFKRSLYQQRINSYYNSILKKTLSKSYDYLFVIKGEVVPSAFLTEFKKRNPSCQFIFYTWDSFSNNPNAVSILKHFDKKFTFDCIDAEKYQIDFRPLFFIDEYEKINKLNAEENKYALLFLGTAHSDRYLVSNHIVNWCTSNGLSSYAYYFVPSRLVYFHKFLFDNSFKSFDYKKLSFNSLKITEIIDLYRHSHVVLDINHPGQYGLTMRTFEALGSGKKIITTNKEIKKYPFYNDNNIFIIDRDNIKLNKSFFQSQFIPIEDDLRDSMSITGWLKTLFIKSESNYWDKVNI